MRIIYRMRGLLGDATEEFIESLDSTTGTLTFMNHKKTFHKFYVYKLIIYFLLLQMRKRMMRRYIKWLGLWHSVEDWSAC